MIYMSIKRLIEAIIESKGKLMSMLNGYLDSFKFN